MGEGADPEAKGDEGKKQTNVAGNAVSPATEKEKRSGSKGDSKSTVSNFVQAAGGSKKKALEQYIASFASKGTGKGKKSQGNQLGSAPPCRSFRSLITFEEFESRYSISEIESMRSKQELITIVAKLKPFQEAYKDLLAMSKGAVVRLTNAMKENAEQKQKTVSTAAKKRGRPAKTAPKAPSPAPRKFVLEASAEGIAVDFKTINVNKDGVKAEEFDTAEPCIFRLPPEVMEEWGQLKELVTKCEEKIKDDPAVRAVGRSQRKVPDELSNKIRDFFKKVFPDTTVNLGDITDETLLKDMTAICFAVAAGNQACSIETGHMGTLRLGLRGTRELVVTRTHELMNHIEKHTFFKDEKKDADEQKKKGLYRVYHIFKTMSVEAAKSYVDAGDKQNGADHTI